MRYLLALLAAIALSTRAATVGDSFSGSPIVINGTPGATTVFEAENFDKGGEGVAFHDPHNCGATNGAACSCTQTYRPDGVNVCTAGTVVYVSYDDAGMWVDYTINVAAVGDYTVELLVAFADATCCGAAAYHVELDGMAVTKSVPLGPTLTAGWTSFEWRGKSELIPMVPGQHVLRVVVDHGWFNWDSIRVKYAAGIEWQTVPVWRVYP